MDEFREQGPLGNPLDVLGAGARGFARGLTGKDKKSYEEVATEDFGMSKGVPTSVAGFVGDVALDPTTYLTLGTGTAAKAGGQTVKIGRGAARGGQSAGKVLTREAAEELLEQGSEVATKNLIDQLGTSAPIFTNRRARAAVRKDAVDAAKASAKASGTRITKKELKTISDDALQSAANTEARDVAELAVEQQDLIKALGRNKAVELKFMGQKIGSSTAAYKPIRVASDVIGESRFGQRAAKMFRTDATISNKIRAIERAFSNVSASRFESDIKTIRDQFGKTDLGRAFQSQRKQVSHAMEVGPAAAGIDGSPKMMQMYDTAKDWFQKIADDEVATGALDPDELVDNYLYHVYQQKPRAKFGKIKPGVKKFPTLQAAKDAGVRPVEDIADIIAHRLAKSHRVVSRYDFHQNIAKQFGMEIGSGSVKDKAFRKLTESGHLVSGKKVSSIMPEGTYFDVEVGDALKQLDEFWTSEDNITHFGKMYDGLQAKLKFMMTAPNPGFHIRNLMGDVFVNMLDGVVDPRVYNSAMDIILDERNIKKFTGTVKIGKKKFTGQDIMALYEGQGLKSGYFHADTGLVPTPGRGVISGASARIRSASELREDWTRMAHFIDAMKKEAGTVKGAKMSTERLASGAAARVKKYNFDYQDLTPFEKKVMRRAVPFYTFMRKNIPLQLESLFTRPGRMAMYPKGLRAMQNMIGEEQSEDPFPGFADVLPDWIREFPSVQTQAASSSKPSIFMQPDLPVNQLQDWFGGFMNDEGDFTASGGAKQAAFEGVGSISPLVNIGLEYSTGNDIQTGAPLKETALKDIILNQIPSWGTGRAVLTPDEKQGEQMVPLAGQQIPERLLNWITGQGVRVNTPTRQQSQLRKDEDIIAAILAALRAKELAEAE